LLLVDVVICYLHWPYIEVHYHNNEVYKIVITQIFICASDGSTDIVEEAIYYFKANIFFKNFEIKV
jgi:hypothetical protein